jgi:pimeloyl-ACP methyl ester carboxylesterase
MLHITTAGKGIPVLLIHAFPLSHAMWKNPMEPLSQYACVVVPDMPGFGASSRQGKPSIPDMAREAAAALDEMKIKDPAVVCGLSMGGYIAFEFLRQFPKRVRALGLFSTRAAADTPEARENRFKTADKINTDGLGAFSKAVLPKLLGRTTLIEHPNVAKQVTDLILANKPGGVADALLAMAHRNDSTDLLAGIKVPTLVVAGEEDSFIPAAESESMAEAIPGAEFHLIKQAGHLVNMEKPEEFTRTLDRFIVSNLLKTSTES